MILNTFNDLLFPSNIQLKPKPGMGLSIQKKRTVSNYVIYLHDAFFNLESGEKTYDEFRDEPLHLKLKAIMTIAEGYAKSLGATVEDIHETVTLTSVHCSYQRSIGLPLQMNYSNAAELAAILPMNLEKQEIA